MSSELSSFAARLRAFIAERDRSPVAAGQSAGGGSSSQSAFRVERAADGDRPRSEKEFNTLALELFTLQFANNAAYRKICEARRRPPLTVAHWSQIPAVPPTAFKELELSCLSPAERTHVFHSSGTTGQPPSRHFHHASSLAVYEASLWPWLAKNLRLANDDLRLWSLTPPAAQVPHSSLVYMFDIARQRLGAEASAFVGRVGADGSWAVDFAAARAALTLDDSRPLLVLGTAFAFVHLLEEMAARKARWQLPPGSRVLETGGYKGRSRALPKAELHALITESLAVPASHIVCEYGMSELSSQAYDRAVQSVDFDLPHPGPLPKEREYRRQSVGEVSGVGDLKARVLQFPAPEPCSRGRESAPSESCENAEPTHVVGYDSEVQGAKSGSEQSLPGGEWQGERKRNPQTASLGVSATISRYFHFPPWARVQIISPETGREVGEGETGLLRVFDLANVFSVLAIQTEDLAVRRGDGFELIGRAQLAEPRGCSLMAV